MGIVDTHCHLDLIEERGLDLEEVARQAQEAGIESLLQIATDLESSRWNRRLSERWPQIGTDNSPKMYWSVGLHPEAASKMAELDSILEMAREHKDDPHFWGLGETGLDYFHSTEYKKEQLSSLEQHLELAQDLGLPVVLHTRDARSYDPEKTASITDAFAICRRYPEVRGVLHCYTYTEKEALPYVRELGWYVSYSGVLTFKNARLVQEGASKLPLSCLLVETDAPFLAPVPHRGETNQPAYTRHTHDFLVGLRAQTNGEDPQEIRQALHENSMRFLALKGRN